MNRQLKEIARVIRGLDVNITPNEENELLKIEYQDSPLCVIGTNGIRWNPENATPESRRDLIDKISDEQRNIKEYINAYEKAPPLEAEDLEGGYVLLTEHNGVVLAAKDMNQYGYQFVTWERTYGNKGVVHGNYYNDNYIGAKQNFAVRSGLVDEQRIFSDEQMKDIYRALDYYRCQNSDITIKQEEAVKDLMEKIECALPGAEAEELSSKNDGMAMS